MKTKTVRYTLIKEAKYLITENGEKLVIPQFIDQTVFVDILGPMEGEGVCELVKVRLFFPNGEILTGSVVGYNIGIHNKDALYDGRFNSQTPL